MTDMQDDIAIAQAVIDIESGALGALRGALGDSFSQTVDLLLSAQGYVIVAGVGKSGHIAQKIAASLASTGTPAFFLHPTEASHGDLGMVIPGSVVLAISYSGESRELLDLLRFCKSTQVPVVGLTRAPDSILGRNCDVVLQLPQYEEACPNGLAPTSSTTMSLVMGDALTVALMARRDFSKEDFGSRHPGGKLGKSLHTVGDYLMSTTIDVPITPRASTLEDVVQAIAEGRQGCVAVVDEDGCYLGIITDGDLRRSMGPDAPSDTAENMMTPGGVCFHPGDRIALVIDTMSRRRISNGYVLDDRKPVGVIHMKDLLAEGYI